MHHPSTYVCTEVVDFKISLFPSYVCINHIHTYVGSDLDYPLPLFSPLNIINFLCFLWMCLSSRASFPFCFPHCSHCVTFCNWHEVGRSYLHSAPIMKHCQIQAPEKYLPPCIPTSHDRHITFSSLLLFVENCQIHKEMFLPKQSYIT